MEVFSDTRWGFLLAKGYNQVKGLDYNKVFAIVAKFSIIKCLITIALSKEWSLYQMDVNNAFLNGNLDKDVNLKILQGLYMQNTMLVCKLYKSLYRLKQVSR